MTDIRRVAKLVGHAPSSVDYEQHGNYSLPSVNKFGSWAEVIKECGLRYKRTTGKYKAVTNEEIEKDLKRVALELGKPPTRTEYMKHGKYDDGTVTDRTEAKRWPETLAMFLKIDIDEARKYGKNGDVYRTREECLDELRELARKLHRAPSEREAIAHHINVVGLRKKVASGQGSWERILKEAGLDQLPRSRQATTQKMTNKDLLSDVVRVARLLGHIPTYREYKTMGRASAHTACKRLGSWSEVKALTAERLEGKLIVKELGEVKDPMRDMLKHESIEAIRSYFTR